VRIYTLQVRDFTDAREFTSKQALYEALSEVLKTSNRATSIYIKAYDLLPGEAPPQRPQSRGAGGKNG
jgi:hypothetical protein